MFSVAAATAAPNSALHTARMLGCLWWGPLVDQVGVWDTQQASSPERSGKFEMFGVINQKLQNWLASGRQWEAVGGSRGISGEAWPMMDYSGAPRYV